MAACFNDRLDRRSLRHSLAEMAAQRVNGLAPLGSEDVNDHRRLRESTLSRPRSGNSALNRPERGARQADHVCKIHCRQERFDALLARLFLEAHVHAPERVVLDVEMTDLPLHEWQEVRFFPGFSDQNCFSPLSILRGGTRRPG